VDWWEHNGMLATMGTARFGRDNRFDLLPLLGAGQADWLEGKPPAFPQPQFWATSRAVRTPNCTFSVIEIDLGRPMPATSISIAMSGICPGLALYGAVAEVPGGMETLAGTKWRPLPRYREPRTIFNFTSSRGLEGWQLEGDAFSVAPVPHLFTMPTLNSLAKGGESATGRALSPVFELAEDESVLEVVFQGGKNAANSDQGPLRLAFIDADTGEVLGELNPPGTHTLAIDRAKLSELGARRLRLELLDKNSGDAYAWIGLERLRVLATD
jgi:hypothetical protein